MPWKDAARQKAYGARYHQQHKDDPKYKRQRAQSARRWRLNHPERFRELKRINGPKETLRVKLEAFQIYGGIECACCGVDEIDFLSLDHIDNDRDHSVPRSFGGVRFYKWLRRHGYPQRPRLQVLCMNCQFGRKINNGVCPHQVTDE